MRRDTKESIRAALREVWSSGGRLFATFEDAEHDDVFVQYLDGQLSVAWPFDTRPETELPRRGVTLPGGVFVVSSAPGGTALLAAGDLRLDETAELVARLLERVLSAADVTCRVDRDR